MKSLEFKDVCLRYKKNNQFALKDVSFKVEECMRVGIVGRTGAGKSSIVQSIFKLIDIESGDIFLGEKSFNEISLEELRRNIGYIPQTPFLF